ncbi:MAG: 2Fe-2S iron-sulfur cluster-binding protein, partial [Pseudomonadota bacterium]
GLSVLEMGQTRDVPHAALCGARGRCGSCAIRIVQGVETLSPIGRQEAETLAKRSGGPHIRLACQAIPQGGTVMVETVYPPEISPRDYQALLRESPPDLAEADPVLASGAGQ